MRFTDAGAGTDLKHWNNVANGNEFYWQAIADNGSGGGNLFKFLRSGNDLQSFEGTNSGSTCRTTLESSKVAARQGRPRFSGSLAEPPWITQTHMNIHAHSQAS